MTEDQTNLDSVSIEERLKSMEQEILALKEKQNSTEKDNTVSIICFSGEWDKLYAALTIAAGSLAMGSDVHLFFTFWAICVLRKKGLVENKDKTFVQSMMGKMMPSGPGKAKLSKFNFMGLGKVLMNSEMKKTGVMDLNTLFEEVKDLGAVIHLCDTTTQLFGLKCEDLNAGENVDQCGVATFLSQAFKSKMVLFI